MSSDKHWIDKNHYREVSDDGETSYVYKANNDLFFPDPCVEIAKHHSDGTTTAYEYDNSIFGSIFHGSRGDKK